jgi:hypothetical protein
MRLLTVGAKQALAVRSAQPLTTMNGLIQDQVIAPQKRKNPPQYHPDRAGFITLSRGNILLKLPYSLSRSRVIHLVFLRQSIHMAFRADIPVP